MIGSIFKGYRIIKELGKGGFGAVYYGQKIDGDPEADDFHVAIKVLLSLHCKDDVLVKRFHREAKLAKRLSHPNVVAILDHGVENEVHYIIMEYAVGKTMLQYLKDMSLPDAEEIKIELSASEDSTVSLQAIDLEQKTVNLKEDHTQTINFKPDTSINTPLNIAIPLMKQCAAVLQSAYELGMIHRDLKPENILLRKDKRGEIKVKILDFGLAKNFVDESMQLSMDGQIFGTPSYMSPEQYRGKKLDIRSDLYSLGASFYTFITNEKPFKGPKIRDYMKQILELPHKSACEVNQKVPKSLSDIIDRLLEKDKEKRYSVPEALIEDLNRSIRGESLLNSKAKKGNYAKSIFISILLLCVVAIGGWCFFKFYYFPKQQEQKQQILQQLDQSLDKVVQSEYAIKELPENNFVIEDIKEEEKPLQQDEELSSDFKEIVVEQPVAKIKLPSEINESSIVEESKEENILDSQEVIVKETYHNPSATDIQDDLPEESTEDNKEQDDLSEDIQTITTPSLDEENEEDIEPEAKDPEEVVGFTKAFTKGKIATSAKDRFKLLNQ